MHVIYSWDCNVLRAIPNKGSVICLPLTLGRPAVVVDNVVVSPRRPGGRSLKPWLLKFIAEKWIRGTVTKFTYLHKGEGYAA